MQSFWPPIMRLYLQWTAAVVLLAGATQAQGLGPLQPGAANGCGAKVAALPAVGPAPLSVVDYSLWRTMSQAWNAQRPNQQKIIRDRLATFLHDINIALPEAPYKQTLFNVCSFVASPVKKTFHLSYRAPGNNFSARRSKAPLPTPKVSGNFDLDVLMIFTTGGLGGEPLVLEQTQVVVSSFRYTGSLDPGAQSDGKKFARQTFADAGIGAFVAADANRFFRLQFVNQTVASVTPGARPEGGALRLFFDVRAARPAIGIAN